MIFPDLITIPDKSLILAPARTGKTTSVLSHFRWPKGTYTCFITKSHKRKLRAAQRTSIITITMKFVLWTHGFNKITRVKLEVTGE